MHKAILFQQTKGGDPMSHGSVLGQDPLSLRSRRQDGNKIGH